MNERKIDEDNVLSHVEEGVKREFSFATALPLRERPSVPSGIDATLNQRNSTHGEFYEDARIAQALKHVIRDGKNWPDLSPPMREALDNSMTKIARILAGNPNYPEHWDDIIGYATLVRRNLP